MIHSFSKFHRNVSTTAALADAIITGGTDYKTEFPPSPSTDNFPDYVVPGSESWGAAQEAGARY